MIMLGILSYYFYHVGSGNRYQEADQLDSQQVLTSEIQTEPNREEEEKTQFAKQVAQKFAEQRAERRTKWRNISGDSGGNWGEGYSDSGWEGSGGDERARTADPHVANVVLSQLSYIPTLRP